MSPNHDIKSSDIGLDVHKSPLAIPVEKQAKARRLYHDYLARHASNSDLYEPLITGSDEIASNSDLYEPLMTASDEIRLVVLYRGQGNSEIACTLMTVELGGDCPDYMALSYEWGSENSRKHNILISGQIFAIRDNLYQALTHIRSGTEMQYLWIDAICINQGDNRERNHQVGIMGKIYRQAQAVRVWLGSGDYSSRAAFELLESIYNNPHLYSAWPEDRELGFCQTDFDVSEGRTSWWRKYHSAISIVKNASYWNRIW